MTRTTADKLRKKEFDNEIKNHFKDVKNGSLCFISRTKYEKLLNQVKTGYQRRQNGKLSQKFSIVTVKGEEKLAAPNSTKRGTLLYASQEELYNVISKAHTNTTHGNLSEMSRHLKNKYKNVSEVALKCYLKLCPVCSKKMERMEKAEVTATNKDDESKENKHRKVVSRNNTKTCESTFEKQSIRKPVEIPPKTVKKPKNNLETMSTKPFTHGMRTSHKIDFIEMINDRNSDYNYIVVLRESTTKFVHLRPMRLKNPYELSHVLFSIFLCFGTPSVLITSNPDFIRTALEGIYSAYPSIPSDIEIEMTENTECFADIETLMLAWVCQNTNDRWYNALRFIQYIANLTYNEEIRKTPFEAMFGRKGKMDVSSLNLPPEIINGIRTEDDPPTEIEGDEKDVDISDMLEVVLNDDD